MNPLDHDKPFCLDLMNPNQSFSKTKDGAKYRVSFEVTQEDWQRFVDAETAGMVIEAQMMVTARNTKPVEKPKGGSLSKNAAMMCQESDFQNYVIYNAVSLGINPNGDPNEEDAKLYIYKYCGITSRAELDHSEVAAMAYENLKSDYLKWLGEE